MAKKRVLKNLNTRPLSARIIERAKERKAPKNAKGSKWLEIRNQTAESADLYIYDEISWFGVLAIDVVEAIQGLDVETIHLRLNSPGGLVFEGMAIYNLLRDHKAKVVVHVDGLAASIASVIAMAGDEIVMAENALMMIHDPSTIVWGNAEDLRRDADLLDKIKDTIVRTYGTRSSYEEKEIRELMSEETWFDADQAVEAGLADRTTEAKKAAALAAPVWENFSNLPDGWEWAEDGGEPQLADASGEGSRRDAKTRSETMLQYVEQGLMTKEDIEEIESAVRRVVLKRYGNGESPSNNEEEEEEEEDDDEETKAASRAKAAARGRELRLRQMEAGF